MQRMCDHRPLFVAALVAMKIQLLRFVPEIAGIFRLRKDKECEALVKSRRRNLAFQDFGYGAGEFLLQIRRRFKTSLDRFVDRPKGLAAHETVARVATGP